MVSPAGQSACVCEWQTVAGALSVQVCDRCRGGGGSAVLLLLSVVVVEVLAMVLVVTKLES